MLVVYSPEMHEPAGRGRARGAGGRGGARAAAAHRPRARRGARQHAAHLSRALSVTDITIIFNSLYQYSSFYLPLTDRCRKAYQPLPYQ